MKRYPEIGTNLFDLILDCDVSEPYKDEEETDFDRLRRLVPSWITNEQILSYLEDLRT